MENLTLPFPPMPQGAGKSIIEPSPKFKKYVYRSIGAIVLFVLTYLILFFCSLAIAIAFAILGYAILTAGFSFISLIAGIGFMVAGLLLFFFIIKFLFKHTKTDYSGMVKIEKNEQPALFEFINKLTEEIGSPKPRYIFLTANVNASVFYNSSFWSMFFPVRKNLQIGLGLVSSINISEFKAVMAHEFGHFSQRSMKFGSYVYNVNKVIHNMLFENREYGKLLNRWARMHGIFRLLAAINIGLIKGMQVILKKVYVVVNKTHMGLSREMEYHADAIAAYAGGSNQAIASLNRIEFGQVCYDNLLNYLNIKLGKNKRSENLFVQLAEVIKLYCKKNDLDTDQSGLPIIEPGSPNLIDDSIEIDDPWSSHPLTKDRTAHLKSLEVNTKPINQSAWSLFENRVKIQETLTGVLYLNIEMSADVAVISQEEFETDFTNALNSHRFNEVFKDYFDNRDITQFEIDEIIQSANEPGSIIFGQLLSDENAGLPEKILKSERNLSQLNQIIEARKDVKHFYYKSAKLGREDAQELKVAIAKEAEDARTKISELDKLLFAYFYHACKDEGIRAQLVNKYRLLFKCQTDASKDYELYNDIMAAMKPVYSKMKPPRIRETVNEVYLKEKTVKPRIKEIIADDEVKNNMSQEDLKAINIYLKTNWLYYLKPNYDNNAINVFNKAMNAYMSVVYTKVFSVKKDLLDFQAGLLNKE